MNNLINIGLYLSYILLAITILSIIVIPVYFTIINFRKAKQGLVGFGVLVIIIILAYLVSPADQGLFYDTHKIGTSVSKIIGGGLFTTYFAFIAIVIVVIYSEVGKLLK
jgi:hypothetical protein